MATVEYVCPFCNLPMASEHAKNHVWVCTESPVRAALQAMRPGMTIDRGGRVFQLVHNKNVAPIEDEDPMTVLRKFAESRPPLEWSVECDDAMIKRGHKGYWAAYPRNSVNKPHLMTRPDALLVLGWVLSDVRPDDVGLGAWAGMNWKVQFRGDVARGALIMSLLSMLIAKLKDPGASDKDLARTDQALYAQCVREGLL